MITINPKLVTALLFSLTTSIPIIANADTNESRANQIINLTKESEKDNKESSIQEQSKLFIQDLRKKYPHFSEDQLQSMQRAYEDTVLENVTAPKIAVTKKKVQDNLVLTETPTKKKLPRKIEDFVSKRITKKETKKTSKSQKEIKDEAKNTVISLTVKKGDTLSDIARREYGDPNMYIAIYEENKDKLRSPRVVPAGITLKVPKIDSSMKEKFAKMKKDYENSIAAEKKKKQAQRKKLKEKKQQEQRERKRKEQEEKREKEKLAEKETKKEEIKPPKQEKTTPNREDEKTYKSMEELQRLILEGKY